MEERKRNLEEMLKEKLETMPSTLEERKKIVRHLVDLECPGDPAWDCLQNQHDWLIQLFASTKDDFLSKEKLELAKEGSSAAKTPSDLAGLLTTAMPSRPGAEGRRESGGDAAAASADAAATAASVDHIKSWIPPFLVANARAPPKVAFVEAISDILVEQLPNLWRLGQAYFSGKKMFFFGMI